MVARHEMSDYALTVIIVGHVHCSMTFHTISRALGYRPTSTLYYPWRRIQETYEQLSNARDPLYTAWGPAWQEVGLVTADMLARRIDVIHEGLRRTRYVEKQLELRTREVARRKRAWGRILGVVEAGADFENLKWDALAEKGG